MDNNNKGEVGVGVMIIAVIIAAGLGYLAATYSADIQNLGEDENIEETVLSGSERVMMLTNEMALELVKEKGGDCAEERECSSITAEVMEYEGGVYKVIATYEGLRDDSVTSRRVIMPVSLVGDDAWVLSDPEEGGITWRCAEGRGHADFSTEPCS